MIQRNRSRISIVIPVYNEADRLDACLRAIAAQDVSPYEVIVVDNNSTDDTVLVARRYSFVTLLHESRQGVTHARDAGFNAAKGDIIGRIDADSLLPADWVKQVTSLFEDSATAAVSGPPHYYDQSFSAIGDAIDHLVRAWLSRKLADTRFLYGSNMALRRSAWRRVRGQVCLKNGLHEDLDLAIHLQQLGLSVKYDPHLIVGVSSRRIDSDLRAYVPYTLVGWHTYAAHGLSSKRHMWLPIATAWICHAPGRVFYRAYDRKVERFSWSKLLITASDPRVDPTTNIV